MSMNSVYAVSLPQLESARATTICVPKNDKHFALKVIRSEAQFDQEVRCIAQINKYFDECDFPEGEFSQFYAFGSRKWREKYVSHSSNEPVDFESIRFDISRVFGDLLGLEDDMHALAVRNNCILPQQTPWWLYDPSPATPLKGGVIVMLCGNYRHKITPDTVQSMSRGVQYWLDLYHKARVVHRDVRASNILRFSPPPQHRHVVQKTVPHACKESCLQWQLIDFNLGYCLEESKNHVQTTLQRGFLQWKNAGWLVQQILQRKANDHRVEQIAVLWTYLDDDQMFLDLLLKILDKRTSMT